METMFAGTFWTYFPWYWICKIITFKTKLILNAFISFVLHSEGPFASCVEISKNHKPGEI